MCFYSKNKNTEDGRPTEHKVVLVKEQCKLDVTKYIFKKDDKSMEEIIYR